MDIIADLHTHTIACGHAYSTLEEMVRGAKENGIEILATTDHGPRMPGGCHPYYFYNLAVLPEVIDGIRVLKGIETNITDIRGTLDLPVAALKELDIVLAGMHPLTGYDGGTEDENTEAMINAIKNPLVDVIVHPGNPEFEVNVNQVVEAALNNDTILEINNSSFRKSRAGSWSNCLEIAKAAKKFGLEVIVSSDAHFSQDVGKMKKALQLIKKANLEEKDILNTSIERVTEFINTKKKVRAKI
ncbi:phosphatase [Sporohalobacter salinus]|uniref:phosphatase n=1 Tax=Sporohalobacter salinus TaxID=1494606 RepID=UPI001960132A|nr:phosphatase [Sporohalobacter salinus]MBM7624200.1 putative hydrolase [Sporohalobacter salinus]